MCACFHTHTHTEGSRRFVRNRKAHSRASHQKGVERPSFSRPPPLLRSTKRPVSLFFFFFAVFFKFKSFDARGWGGVGGGAAHKKKRKKAKLRGFHFHSACCLLAANSSLVSTCHIVNVSLAHDVITAFRSAFFVAVFFFLLLRPLLGFFFFLNLVSLSV